MPFKTPKGGKLTGDKKAYNVLPSTVRAPAERGNALLKKNFKALDKVSMSPSKITQIAAAALIVLHIERDRSI